MSFRDSRVDLVVEDGGLSTIYHFCDDWHKGEKKGEWVWRSEQSSVSVSYGNASTGDKKISIKCDFLKVKEYVLLIFQTYGATVSPVPMRIGVRSWLDHPEADALSESKDFFKDRFWNAIKHDNWPFPIENPEEKESSKEDLFPYGAKFGVQVDNDYDMQRLIERIKEHYSDSSLLRSSEVREFPFRLEKSRKMTAFVTTMSIKDLSVAFIRCSSTGDRKALEEKAREWFPNAKYYLPKERASEFLAVVLNQSRILKLTPLIRLFAPNGTS